MRKLQHQLSPIVALILLSSCATQTTGDPVVVNAERTTQVAFDTFESFKKYEYNNRATLEKVNPRIEHYANVIRRNEKQWLQTARAMTMAYKYNRNAQNKANMDTAIAVLQAAIAQIGQYMGATGQTNNKGDGTYLTMRVDEGFAFNDPKFKAKVTEFDNQIPLTTTARSVN